MTIYEYVTQCPIAIARQESTYPVASTKTDQCTTTENYEGQQLNWKSDTKDEGLSSFRLGATSYMEGHISHLNIAGNRGVNTDILLIALLCHRN